MAFRWCDDAEDSYHGNRSNGIKIKPGQRKNSSKHFIAQSLPMAVPIYSQRSDDEYDDVKLAE